jgi:hypothetical protein
LFQHYICYNIKLSLRQIVAAGDRMYPAHDPCADYSPPLSLLELPLGSAPMSLVERAPHPTPQKNRPECEPSHMRFGSHEG